MMEQDRADEAAAGGRRSFWLPEGTLEIVAAIMLAVASLATTWCAYQATRWGGVQSLSFAEASSARIESSREFNRSMQVLAIDADLFLGWVNAYNADNQELLEFYETNLIRPEFMPYLEEWIASNPRETEDADQNPLVAAAYQQSMFARSSELRNEAEAKFAKATNASQTSDEYILTTVMFASVLFFAGVSSKFSSIRVRQPLVGMSLLMFMIGLVQLVGLPVH